MHAHDHEDALPGEPSASAPADPLSAARALIEQDHQLRAEACAKEIQEVLDKHGMRLHVPPAQVTIVPA